MSNSNPSWVPPRPPPAPVATGTEGRVCDFIAERQYGRWTLLNELSGGRHPKWRALCECGKEKVVDLGNVKSGKSLSCGCLRKELTSQRCKTHGHTSGVVSRTYKSWSHMKGRCLNPSDHAFKDYGGRGIRVHQAWIESFDRFLADMGESPLGHTIERLDVNGNYEPSNCVWLHKRLQARNTRANKFTSDQVEKIRERLTHGDLPSVIARDNAVSAGHIRQIRRGDIWASIDTGAQA